MAEHPTHPVGLDTTSAIAEADDVRSRNPSETISGAFGASDGDDATVNLGQPYDTEANFEVADEPTRAVDMAPLPAPRLEPTGSTKVPELAAPSRTREPANAPKAREMLAGRYRIDAHLSQVEGGHLYLATARTGAAVVVRLYDRPEIVRQRSAWQRLRSAYAEGAVLPELLRSAGVVPLLDLFEDEHRGPVVVTASLPGGWLSAQAPHMTLAQLGECFTQIASVMMRAHATGVTIGRIFAEDVALDEYGSPHLDLTVAAFGDALEVINGSVVEDLSPETDVAWLGRMMQACLPTSATGPDALRLALVAQDCVTAEPRPTAADVLHRLQAIRTGSPADIVAGRARWSPLALLGVGALVALITGWIVGGGLSSPVEIKVADPVPAQVARALEDGGQAFREGAYLAAGLRYRSVLDLTADPQVHAAWSKLLQTRAYRRALKDLKKRLAAASDLTPDVRRDIEMLRILQPDSLVLKHWLGRLAENEGKRP